MWGSPTIASIQVLAVAALVRAVLVTVAFWPASKQLCEDSEINLPLWRVSPGLYSSAHSDTPPIACTLADAAQGKLVDGFFQFLMRHWARLGTE